jgi:hypothetical protein
VAATYVDLGLGGGLLLLALEDVVHEERQETRHRPLARRAVHDLRERLRTVSESPSEDDPTDKNIKIFVI